MSDVSKSIFNEDLLKQLLPIIMAYIAMTESEAGETFHCKPGNSLNTFSVTYEYYVHWFFGFHRKVRNVLHVRITNVIEKSGEFEVYAKSENGLAMQEHYHVPYPN